MAPVLVGVVTVCYRGRRGVWAYRRVGLPLDRNTLVVCVVPASAGCYTWSGVLCVDFNKGQIKMRTILLVLIVLLTATVAVAETPEIEKDDTVILDQGPAPVVGDDEQPTHRLRHPMAWLLDAWTNITFYVSAGDH